MTRTFVINELDEWRSCVEAILPGLRPGMILALSGPLGAGKTTFVQVLARALGFPSVPKSPTFSLLRTHTGANHPSGISRLVHVDAYRIEHPKDADVLALDEERSVPGTILCIEWPEHVGDWIEMHEKDCIHVTINMRNEDASRTLCVEQVD